jgi:hypothetical protein
MPDSRNPQPNIPRVRAALADRRVGSPHLGRKREPAAPPEAAVPPVSPRHGDGRILGPEPGEESSRRGLVGRITARIAIPLAILVAGIVLVLAGQPDIGVGLFAIVPIVILVNLFARLSISSQADREREGAALDEFTRTGKW